MTGAHIRIAGVVSGAIALLVAGIIIFALNARLDLRTLERNNARADVKAEQGAHQNTVANYRAASAAAQLAANRNVERVKAEQAAISERTISEYEDRLAAVDARLMGVRAETAARADLGSANLAPVSITRDATCQAYGGGSCDALLAKLAIAERQAENLVALRAWVRDQANVQVVSVPSADGR